MSFIGKKAWRMAGFAVVAASLIFFSLYISENLASMPPLRWNPETFSVYAGSLILYLAHLMLAAFGWIFILQLMGLAPKKKNTIGVFLVAQFAKYIPGNFAHHMGRVGLAKEKGLPVSHVVPSMLVELGLLAASSILLYGLMAVSATKHEPFLFVLTLFTILLISLPLLSRLLLALRPHVQRWTKGQLLIVPNHARIAACLAIYPIIFLVLGGILSLMAFSCFGAQNLYWISATSAFALSWLAGFVTPGAPAGIGVREVVFVTLIEPSYGAGIALSLAIVFRLLTSLGDLIALSVGLFMLKSAR